MKTLLNPILFTLGQCISIRSMIWARSFAIITILSIINIYVYADEPNFGDQQDMGLIEYYNIREASGIAASRKNKDVLWTHNDSGDINRIYAFDTQGRHLGIYRIEGARSVDWEDMAVGPGPVEGQHYIYIGDIGDNSIQRKLISIYRVPEPDVYASQSPIDSTITGVETINFQYPDGSRDAETLMVDPLTKDIYVVSKMGYSVRVYLAPFPQSTTETIILDHVATLSIRGMVGGDISPTGLEILIKTYFNMYYWCRTPGQSLSQVFENEPVTVPYTTEPQGEAVGWASDGMGYYTISEEARSTPAHLYFYPRLTALVVTNEDKIFPFQLYQNYPNPFNPSTTIQYTIPDKVNKHVSLKLYDLRGALIKTLVDQVVSPGNHSLIWNGTDDTGNKVSSGIYLYQLQAGEFTKSNKMILMR